MPPVLYYGNHQRVKNSVKGIGISLYDSTITYGSAGRLQGVTHLSYLAGLRYGPSLHELMHQWGNFIVETSYPSHWGFSSGGGQLGGFKRDTLVDLGGGIFQANNGNANSTTFSEHANGGTSLPYSEIELYLMGMKDKAQVQPLIVAVNPQWTDYSTGKFSADGFTEYAIEDIIQTHGDRIPSVNDSQKIFKAIAVVLTPRPLTETEWENVDQQVANFSLAGDDGNPSNYTFREATSGLATILMDNLENSLKLKHQDGTLDLADAILILQILSGGQPIPAISKKADVNKDGMIGLPEAIYILQGVAGMR